MILQLPLEGPHASAAPREGTVPSMTCGREGAATCELEYDGVREMMWPTLETVTGDPWMETPVQGSHLESSLGTADESAGQGLTSSS